MMNIIELPVHNIDIPHPRSRDEKEFNNLVNNIEKQGLLHPIKVRQENNHRYTLVFGEGRLTACRQLGWMLIPAIITDDLEDDELLLDWLTENLQRVEMSPKDKAINIKRLIDKYNYSTKEVAEKLGISTTTVRSLYKVVVRGSERLQNSLNQGMVSSASEIARKIETHISQNEVLDTFKNEKIDKEIDRLSLIRALKKGTVDVKEAITTMKKDHKHYRKLLRVALSREDLITTHLKTLLEDSDFNDILKKEEIIL